MIKLRFAPSPTGNLHIGSARTALFNYLYAKFMKGTFVLRIEDTDTLRSKKEFEDDIISGLKWLGIKWDEGPGVGIKDEYYYQMDRWKEGIYNRYCHQLIESGDAYCCFCSAQDQDKERAGCEEAGVPHKYSGRCRNIPKDEAEARIKAGESFAVRVKVPEEVVTFKDLVRGDISFDMALNGDLVIMRSDGMPTYNFAVVVDDMDMGITHVVRGEDHISNTPKQIQLFKALGKTAPQYGHISMILGPDRAKLSKRHGAKSITEFKNEGYLPEAILNFLALLGWSDPKDREIISEADLFEVYDMARVSKSNSIFNIEKLNWYNGQYIRSYTPEKILTLVKPYLEGVDLTKYTEGRWIHIIESIKDNLTLLTDIRGLVEVFYKDELKYSAEHISEEAVKIISELKDVFEKTNYTTEALTEAANNYCAETGIKKGAIFHPLRYAVSTEPKGPPLFKMLHIFGREKTSQRLGDFIEYAKATLRS